MYSKPIPLNKHVPTFFMQKVCFFLAMSVVEFHKFLQRLYPNKVKLLCFCCNDTWQNISLYPWHSVRETKLQYFPFKFLLPNFYTFTTICINIMFRMKNWKKTSLNMIHCLKMKINMYHFLYILLYTMEIFLFICSSFLVNNLFVLQILATLL